MKIQAIAKTDCGQRRKENEDFFLIDESLGLYVVCDGMGGHAAGEVAAERSVRFLVDYVRKHKEILQSAAHTPDGYFRVLELAEEATQTASEQLHQLAIDNQAYRGMGTTMTVLMIVDNKGIMAHVGDSRLYVLRREEIHQLSNDHTLANELLLTGCLTPEEAVESQYSHVLTRTIGQQERVEVETLLFDVLPGDQFLICSDGLSNYFKCQTDLKEMMLSGDWATRPERLVDYANTSGGSDNITLILLQILKTGEQADTAEVQRRIDALQSTFLCRNFPVRRLMRLLNVTSLVECAAGQELFSRGDRVDGMYVVLDGRLSVSGDPNASDLSAGGCTGETALLKKSQARYSITATEASSLLYLSRQRFGKLVRQIPKLGNALLRNLGQYLSQQIEEIHRWDEFDCADTDLDDTFSDDTFSDDTFSDDTFSDDKD